MIRGAGNILKGVATGTADVVGTVVGGVAGAAAGAVKGAFTGGLKGARGGHEVATGNTQSLLNHARNQQSMINALHGKPQSNTLGHIPRNAALPGGGMSNLAKVGLHEGNKGVAQAGSAMQQSLRQMEQMQTINMQVQTETALMKAIASAHEGLTKVIGKSGDAIKSNAG